MASLFELELELGYNPFLKDSDSNGIPDGDEDYDGDNFSNVFEVNRDNFLNPKYFNELDNDEDGLTIFEEIEYGTSDYRIDSDYDGIPDIVEVNNIPHMNPTEKAPIGYDGDNDGIPDYYESQSWVSFLLANPDSNDDGILDGDEDRDSDGIADCLKNIIMN